LINCEFPTSGSGCCGETVGEAIGELHDLLEEARASSAHCKLYLWVLFVISEVKEYF